MQHSLTNYPEAKHSSTFGVTPEKRQISPKAASEAANTLVNIQHPDNLIDTLNELWAGFIENDLSRSGGTIERHKRNYNAIRLHLQQISNSLLNQKINNLQNTFNMSQPTTTGTMTSREIAELTGKTHADVMKAIRAMEQSWVNVGQSKFSLTYYTDQWNRQQPQYQLTKKECLYIATKFNDEARAKLVIRWEDLETGKTAPVAMTQAEMLFNSAKLLMEQEKTLIEHDSRLKKLEEVRQTSLESLNMIPMSTAKVPELSMKDNIRMLVNKYAAAVGLPYRDVWNSVYKDLFYRYHINARGYKKVSEKESILDVAERKGFIMDIFTIVSDYSRKIKTA